MPRDNDLTPVLDAASAHAKHMLAKADGQAGRSLNGVVTLLPWWHGWALRVSFLAGAQWQKDRDSATHLD